MDGKDETIEIKEGYPPPESPILKGIEKKGYTPPQTPAKPLPKEPPQQQPDKNN